MKLWWKRGLAGEQRGAFLVFTALAIWFLMMFVAFAVDFGNYYQHRARLQNAADAAALAGVAKYADNDFTESATTIGKGRLVKIPTDVVEGKDGEADTFSSGAYTFTKLAGVPDDIHNQGKAYVQRNYRDNMDIKDDSVWSATQQSTTENTTENGVVQTTTTMEKQYCYRVDLEDTVTTFFARIFGVETLSVKVSAMAMLDGTESVTVEELLPAISGHLDDIIPNYYWETIVEQKDSKITDRTKKTADGKDLVVTAKNYGPNNRLYRTSSEQVDSEGKFIPGAIKVNVEGKDRLIIGYQEPEDKNGICADPIYSEITDPNFFTAGKTEVNADVGTLQYTINESFITSGGEDIIGLFLDRDNINNGVKKEQRDANNALIYNNKGEVVKDTIWYGSKERFTEINLGLIKGNNPNVPIYARIESEPIHMAWPALTTVHGITINVNLKAEDFVPGQVKPFVLAYDGPDQNRTDFDAPWVSTATEKITVKKDDFSKDFRPGQINSSAEPLLRRLNRDTSVIPKVMVQTSRTTPGPIVVNIPEGYVFNGVIFAPLSQVTIVGTGRIHGFIAARRIIEKTPCGRKFVTSQKIPMSTLVAIKRGGEENNRFDYEKKYVTDNYNLVYSKSEFVDFTDTKYLKGLGLGF